VSFHCILIPAVITNEIIIQIIVVISEEYLIVSLTHLDVKIHLESLRKYFNNKYV